MTIRYTLTLKDGTPITFFNREDMGVEIWEGEPSLLFPFDIHRLILRHGDLKIRAKGMSIPSSNTAEYTVEDARKIWNFCVEHFGGHVA